MVAKVQRFFWTLSVIYEFSFCVCRPSVQRKRICCTHTPHTHTSTRLSAGSGVKHLRGPTAGRTETHRTHSAALFIFKSCFQCQFELSFWVLPPDACYYVKGAVHPKKLNIQSQSSLLDRDGKSEVLLSTEHFWSSTSKQRCNIFLNSWSRRSLKRKQWNVSQEACVVSLKSLGSFRIPHWFEDVISTLFTQHL